MRDALQTSPARPSRHILLFILMAGVLIASAVWYRAGVNDRLSARRPSFVPTADASAQPLRAGNSALQAAASPRASTVRPPQGRTPTETEMLAGVARNISMLDDRFRNEPLNAEWASRNERHIEAFFSPASLAQEGIVAPLAMKATCHSATCRVSALYADETAAQDASQMLTLHTAGGLPYGAIMPRRLDDGTLELNMWLSSKRISL